MLLGDPAPLRPSRETPDQRLGTPEAIEAASGDCGPAVVAVTAARDPGAREAQLVPDTSVTDVCGPSTTDGMCALRNVRAMGFSASSCQ